MIIYSSLLLDFTQFDLSSGKTRGYPGKIPAEIFCGNALSPKENHAAVREGSRRDLGFNLGRNAVDRPLVIQAGLTLRGNLMNMHTTLVNILTAHHERPVQCRRSRTDDGYTKTLQNTTACKEETF